MSTSISGVLALQPGLPLDPLLMKYFSRPRAPFRESEDNYDSSHEPNSSSGPNEASSYEKVKTIQVGEGRSDESGPELSLHATSPDTL